MSHKDLQVGQSFWQSLVFTDSSTLPYIHTSDLFVFSHATCLVLGISSCLLFSIIYFQVQTEISQELLNGSPSYFCTDVREHKAIQHRKLDTQRDWLLIRILLSAPYRLNIAITVRSNIQRFSDMERVTITVQLFRLQAVKSCNIILIDYFFFMSLYSICKFTICIS